MKPDKRALLFLAVILAAQNALPKTKVSAAELPVSQLAAQALRSVGNRRLLDDTVVRDYTAWCTPTRDSTPAFDGSAQPAFVVAPYDVALIGTPVDLCNSAVFDVNGQPAKLPATITGSVTETSLSDGRQITLALQISGVYAPLVGSSLDEIDNPDAPSYVILGINIFSAAGQPPLVMSGISKEEFFKTLALVQSLTYTLKFELHDNSKPGDPITTPYFDVFDPSIPEITFISEEFKDLVIEGPLRRSPLFPNVPVGNPAEFTINYLALANSSVFTDVDVNILPPDDGSVLETLQKEFANYPPDYILLGTPLDLNATATPTPTPTGTASTPAPTATSTATPVPTGTSAPQGIPPVNGTCNPNSAAPNQCFAASGMASICCPGQCPSPGATPSCNAATAAPTTTPAPTGTTGPTPTPTASASSAPVPVPSTVCDPGSSRPNQCFNSNGSAFVCCPGNCGASGPDPVCAT